MTDNDKEDLDLRRRALISAALGTEAGRKDLADAMVAPIRASLSYASIGRKIFSVTELSPREPVIDSYFVSWEPHD